MSTTAGTWRLVRLALRRDRVTLPVTVVVLVLLVQITAVAITQAYPDEVSRTALSAMVGVNPAFLVLLGPLTSSSVVAAVGWRIGLFMTAILGVVASMSVVRHTRKEEETGRGELVRSGAVGALAPLTAAVVVGVLTVLATALPVMGIMVSLAGMTYGVVLTGFQYIGMGLVGVGLAAAAAQVTTTSRTANAISTTIIMVGYLLRGLGDVREQLSWLRWVAPSGWVELVDPFGAQRIGPGAALIGLALLLGSAGAVTAWRRDLGDGMLRPRPGPAATTRLGSVGALLGRLHGGQVLVWSLSAGAYAMVVGLVVESADQLVSTSPQIQAMLVAMGGARAMSELMVAMVTWFAGLATGAWAVTTVQGLVREESDGRLAQVLAAPVGRGRFFGAASVLVVVGATVIPLVFGALLAAGHLASKGVWPGAAVDAVEAGLVQVPAAAVVGGLALALYGWAPRWVPVAWALIIWSFVADLLSTLVDMPGWLVDLSPYAHVPAVPAEPVAAGPLVWLTVVAVALALTGLVGMRRRDLIG